MEVVYGNKKMHADVTGFMPGDFTERIKALMLGRMKDMILYAGAPNYLIYGADWPICCVRTCQKFVRGLDSPAGHTKKLRRKNANRLFKRGLAES